MRRTTLCLIALLLWSAPSIWADSTIELWEWAFNFSGTPYASGDARLPSTLPAYVNAAGFDFATGLGTLAITFNPGAAGSYYVLAYLDHDLNTLANGFDDELAEPFGVLPAGLIGEIDRPLDGDIYWHVIGDLPGDGLGSDSDPVVPDGPGTFDSFFDVFVGDVSMGLGWNFILAADELATISYHVGTSAPAGGFYLRQLDGGVPSGGVDPIALYFNSTIDIHGGGGPEIPEPGTWLLMLAGLLGVGGVAKRRRTN